MTTVYHVQGADKECRIALGTTRWATAFLQRLELAGYQVFPTDAKEHEMQRAPEEQAVVRELLDAYAPD